MTNTEAIRILTLERDDWETSHCTPMVRKEAFEMAINALEKEAWKEDHPVSPLLQKPALTAQAETHDKRTETHGVCLDVISRQAAIEALNRIGSLDTYADREYAESIFEEIPSVQPDYQEVLDWLLAYHTTSFYLHGRYLPHEVISWLINDFTKEFIAERKTDGN